VVTYCNGVCVSLDRIHLLYDPADIRLPIVGIFALAIGMMHDERKAWRGRALGGPLQHLKIAVRITERCDRTLTDMLVDADGLARPVIDEVHLRKAKQYCNVPAQ